MARSKEVTEKSAKFAEGGDGHMFGQQAAGPDKPGNTGKDTSGAPGAKFAEGGGGKMFGFSGSLPAQSGITSPR